MTTTKASKPAKTKPDATGRTRKAKTTTPAATVETTSEYTTKETELRAKYEHHNILPGSYRVAGASDRPGWGRKHTVAIKCASEGCTSEPRIIATSDLQFSTTAYCVACSKTIRANRRRTQQAKAKLK